MKHQQRRAWISSIGAAVGVLLSAAAIAECVADQPVQANVVVRECLGVTFEASASQTQIGRGPGSLILANRPGRLSGTLLTVEVTSTEGLSIGYPVRTWAKGQLATVYVSEQSAKVCPPVLNGKATVRTTPYCCDTIPRSGLCVLPHSVIPVSIDYATQ
jgi:hypothetical protein